MHRSQPDSKEPAVSIRMLMVAVAVVALSIRWSAHWFDFKHQAALHASLASERIASVGETGTADRAGARRAKWHEEMSRRFERAAWLPWSYAPSESTRPE